MDTFMKWLFGVFAVVIVLLMYGCTMAMKQNASDRKKCEAAGGVYYHPYKSRSICLRSDDVILIRR